MAETWEDRGIGETANAAAQFPGQELLESLSKRQGHWSGKGQCASFKSKPKANDPKVNDLLKRLEDKGVGAFGKVSKSKLCVDGRDTVVATKEIGHCPKDIIAKEIDILKHLQHRHLVTFIGSYTISTSTTIIIYPCASCDLKELLETLNKAQHDGLRDEATNQLRKLGWAAGDWEPAAIHSQLRRICGCIASGLLYLEQKKIRHKDIKPSNILIDSRAAYITDFNVSGNYHGKDSTRTCGPFTGTQWYSAPESLLGEERGSPADVYSLGLVFLEIFAYITGHSLGRMRADYTIDSGRAPEGLPSEEQVQRNANLKIMLVTLSFHESGKENHAMRDLILGMISKNERDRPHAFEVITELWAISPDGQFFCRSCHEHKDCFGYKGLLKRHKLLQDKYKRLRGEIRQQELGAASHSSNVPQLQVQTASSLTRQSPKSPSSGRRTPSSNDIASQPPPPPARQSELAGPSKETHGCDFDEDMHQLDTVPVLDTDIHD
ncbi:uncharacterized protein NECHADRAFT_77519 [Fusarium vanettenii 77-13-4]|uniref:non-specific serine/threonine protein kinase n=1 Tax=Fusarium vanettenii (strain ATCC MYA-4622 / CBS 123669 / FGSC 9596 / NRRL 45880 / 77-13-4) TaxID=660122 RepID=C7YLG1_FUSV7|nr:uncharacterized protein NECHADRAFT_77519 [Fusarium vanettenii 77-13-4]EEU47254.1 hypothetical protein NECHADRAFT_77519 [Fusarium vanettenii 77-13-4]